MLYHCSSLHRFHLSGIGKTWLLDLKQK